MNDISMKKIEIVNKNPIIALSNNEIDILIHAATCQENFGIGIARQIAITYKWAELAHYKYWKSNKKAKGLMLRNFSLEKVNDGNRTYGIVNIYGQVEPGLVKDKDRLISNLRSSLNKALARIGSTKRNGNPIRYGITLIGTEFNSLTKEESLQCIQSVIDYFNEVESSYNLKVYET